MRNFFLYFYLLFFIFSCNSASETPKRNTLPKQIDNDTTLPSTLILPDTQKVAPFEKPTFSCQWDTYLLNQGLINIQTIDSSIWVKLMYSTEDNFMHKDVYGCLENCYLQPDVAARLVLSQQKLQTINSSLSLLLFDGLRPRLIQQYMWDILDMPIHEKTKFVSNPKRGSLHNFGAAVDITIVDKTTGQELDMGTPYDYIGVKAWPSKEKSMLKDHILTQQQVDNRILLRRVLKEGLFFNIQTEWWHFNACYRDKAKELYHIIEGDTALINI